MELQLLNDWLLSAHGGLCPDALKPKLIRIKKVNVYIARLRSSRAAVLRTGSDPWLVHMELFGSSSRKSCPSPPSPSTGPASSPRATECAPGLVSDGGCLEGHRALLPGGSCSAKA